MSSLLHEAGCSTSDSSGTGWRYSAETAHLGCHGARIAKSVLSGLAVYDDRELMRTRIERLSIAHPMQRPPSRTAPASARCWSNHSQGKGEYVVGSTLINGE